LIKSPRSVCPVQYFRIEISFTSIDQVDPGIRPAGVYWTDER
jgi:hypothetical protein